MAAGNSNADACEFTPAASRAAITVAAMERGDKLSWFSNRGPCIDIIAPGSAIASARSGEEDDYISHVDDATEDGPSPRRSRPATTRRRTSPPSRRTGGSRARRRSAAATRCSSPFHDLPLPRRDCRAYCAQVPSPPYPAVLSRVTRSGAVLPSSFGALLHSSRVMSRSLLNSLFVFFSAVVVDGVACSLWVSKPSS